MKETTSGRFRNDILTPLVSASTSELNFKCGAAANDYFHSNKADMLIVSQLKFKYPSQVDVISYFLLSDEYFQT